MRTSQSQFEVMVEFMERHGDLNKPSAGPQGRLSTIAKWEELVEVLNRDPTGCPRTVDKWKKVWSDFKNNIKRKAAKIYKGVSGTGGGPACRLVLTELEQRVLQMVGVQAATGLQGIPEVGLNEIIVEMSEEAPGGSHQVETLQDTETEAPPYSGQSMEEHGAEVFLQQPAIPTQVSAQTQPAPGPTQVSAQSQPAPGPPQRRRRRRHDSSASPPTPTPQRRAAVTPHSRPRRRIFNQTRRAETAADRFIRADERWQQIAAQFVAQDERRRERDQELQAQWQTLFARGLDLFQRYLDRLP